MGRRLWHCANTISGLILCCLGMGWNLSSQGATLESAPLADWFEPTLMLKSPSELGKTQLIAVPSSKSVVATLSPPIEQLRPINLQVLPDIFLPRYPSFDSQLLDQQIVLYSLHLLLSGPPEILIVGSSRAIQGVDPDTLRRALIEQGYPEYEIYNFSINGATAQVIDLLMRQILTPEQLPKMVIWADGSRAFNSGRIDRTYEQILNSEGFQHLENAMHPILYRSPHARTEWCQDIPLSGFTIASQHSTIRTDSAAIAPNLSTVADPWAKLTMLKKTTQSALLKQTPLITPCAQPMLSQSGAWSSSIRRTINRSSSDTYLPVADNFTFTPSFALNATGFLENFTEFDPEIYYETYPYVSGKYDANYVPFSLEGVQTEAMLSVIKHLQQQRIPLVVVNLPLTQNYLDVTRTQYESMFSDHMQQYALQAGFTFIDLNQPYLAEDKYFADPSHLNTIGAQTVAKQLALQSIIPWPNNE
ncbi:MAG: hypothetical protein F6K30_12300 [Cyanothece sp. SIO2G6]|nr:hypothetical protein [Cyanothece sp. SIO2G6]